MLKPPFALQRPLAADSSHQPHMTAHDLIVIHTMCGSLTGTDYYFRLVNGIGYIGTESHFGTGAYAGQITQWTPGDRTADACLDANGYAFSIENADTGTPYPAWAGSNVPPFTNAQVDNNVRLITWLCSKEAHAQCPSTWKCHQEGIPAQFVDASPGARGITVHRCGVDSSPLYRAGYRQPGDTHMSTSIAKACPGDHRIAQAKEVIIPRVAANIRDGNTDGGGGLVDSRWRAFGNTDASDHTDWGITGRLCYGNRVTKASLAARGYAAAFYGVEDIGEEWGPHANTARASCLKAHPGIDGRDELWEFLATPPGTAPKFPGADQFVLGKATRASFQWQNVLLLNDDPVKRTYLQAMGRDVDHVWDEGAVAATKLFQLANDALKGDADGIPGPMTWATGYTVPA